MHGPSKRRQSVQGLRGPGIVSSIPAVLPQVREDWDVWGCPWCCLGVHPRESPSGWRAVPWPLAEGVWWMGFCAFLSTADAIPLALGAVTLQGSQQVTSTF